MQQPAAADSGAEPAVGRAREKLWAICGSTVLVMAGQGITSPVLPLFAREFGATASQVGMTLSAFGLARLVLNIPLGLLADRRGRRALLIGGPLATTVGMVGSALAPNIAVLLLWRFVAGAGSAGYMTGAQIYLTDISTPATRARYLATNQAALLTGVSIGPGVGGLLADLWGLRAPFLVVGATAVLATVYSYVRLPETRDPLAAASADALTGAGRAAARKVDRAHLRAFARSPGFLAVSFITLSVFATRTGGRGVLVVLRGTDEFDLTPKDLGLLFTLTSLLGLVLVGPAGWIADRFGRTVAIAPPTLVAAVGVAMIGLPGLSSFVAGNVIMAVGTSISGPAPAAYVADLAPSQLRGVVMGMYRTVGDVGFVVGPPLLGAISDRAGAPAALYANAALLVVAAIAFLVLVRRQHAPQTDTVAGAAV
ncbi:MAG: MFS transporter [Acidimicrobiia bacterium]|nr:MFS transporter [Acidimicrobiia bacterium]